MIKITTVLKPSLAVAVLPPPPPPSPSLSSLFDKVANIVVFTIVTAIFTHKYFVGHHLLHSKHKIFLDLMTMTTVVVVTIVMISE